MADAKEWPGSADGSCPQCGALRYDWDLEFHIARIDPYPGGLEWYAKPGKEILVGLTCPICRTKFKTIDIDKVATSTLIEASNG